MLIIRPLTAEIINHHDWQQSWRIWLTQQCPQVHWSALKTSSPATCVEGETAAILLRVIAAAAKIFPPQEAADLAHDLLQVDCSVCCRYLTRTKAIVHIHNANNISDHTLHQPS